MENKNTNWFEDVDADIKQDSRYVSHITHSKKISTNSHKRK